MLAQLTSLVRKELVRPDRAQLAGEDAFRFRHLLIRDAAYDALPKAIRAELHERFADWLTEHGREMVELDEILGYHLEQSTRYRQELGSLKTEHERDIATRGAERLCAAGERALARRDLRAAANLLRRGLALLDPDARPLELEWKFVSRSWGSGDLAGARREAGELAARARSVRRTSRRAGRLLVSAFVAFQADTTSMDELRRLADEARSEFDATRDELGIGLSWFALAHVHHNACQWQERQDALERTHHHGVRALDAYLQEQSILWMAAGPVYGPMPTDEGLRWFDANDTKLDIMSGFARLRAAVEAMIGNFDGARKLMRDATARLEELGSISGSPASACRSVRSRCSPAIPKRPRARASRVAGHSRRSANAAGSRHSPDKLLERSSRSIATTKPSTGSASQSTPAAQTT